ncbi:MAG TPA: hypothetical protein VM282_23615 [Acidimicrobiales bacterium]|nr:hypothetical protein [Acidimicrobiales bacterium]
MMSGKVHAVCMTCGPVEVLSADVTVFACVEYEENRFGFICPTCAKWNVKDAAPEVVTLLLRAGACVDKWHPPDGQQRGPITDAEVAAFRAALDTWTSD